MAVVHDIVHQRIGRMTGVLGTIGCAITECIFVDAECLLLFQLFLLFFNQLCDKLLFVYLIVSVDRVLLALLLHDEDGLMRPILDVLVLNVLEHHVEAILHVVLSPTWHLLDDLGPLVTNAETLL